jgi:hypothetical protein
MRSQAQLGCRHGYHAAELPAAEDPESAARTHYSLT